MPLVFPAANITAVRLADRTQEPALAVPVGVAVSEPPPIVLLVAVADSAATVLLVAVDVATIDDVPPPPVAVAVASADVLLVAVDEMTVDELPLAAAEAEGEEPIELDAVIETIALVVKLALALTLTGGDAEGDDEGGTHDHVTENVPDVAVVA